MARMFFLYEDIFSRLSKLERITRKNFNRSKALYTYKSFFGMAVTIVSLLLEGTRVRVLSSWKKTFFSNKNQLCQLDFQNKLDFLQSCRLAIIIKRRCFSNH